ncbi:MAG: diguanylate cyclase [Candidatus Aminicenantes bacterium]|nr:diguanylate cyclase [Candidatus Aminicenantes bacterium]
MKYEEFFHFLKHTGKDPSRLVFEDELTGIYNRRFLLNYFQHKISWDSLEEHPLSLIMMDLDHFKQVNDTYGHPAGDQVLMRIAGILKDLVGEEGMTIRYSGDEFMILMLERDKRAALKLGENIIQRIRETPVTLDEVAEGINITLSMGIASAPEDALSGKSLIHKADTALYYAKKVGRNRLANAGEIAPEDVFAKTALHQLEGEKTAGRGLQLSQVAQSYKVFEKGHSQFLIVEGEGGMGKSTFLDTIRLQLASDEKTLPVKVKGKPQELFYPYYLITDIIVDLLNQREEKGIEVIESLKPAEIAYLSRILPQLKESEEASGEEDEKAQREGIFNTVLHFVPKILEFQPFMIFIDDLQFADEASLLLLRRLMLYEGLPLFVCATSNPIEQLQEKKEIVPLVQFFEAYTKELNISKINLTPLTASDISDHLQGIFPRVSLPENFEKDLVQITQGNPLFLSEILHKLALDQKIPLKDQQWAIEPLEEGYLPESLDDLISHKVNGLDEESRKLLYRAASFGEDVSLSLLTGSSEEMEAKILEFVDQAIALGLLLSDFKANDETIRFLGKRILEKVYEAIQPERKQELHERIGNYQETLYQQRLIPFAANLAYHFKRSTNQEKAAHYEKDLEEYARKIFNPAEANKYTGERRKAERRRQKPSELAPPGEPLDAESLEKIPSFIRYLLATVRHIKLYPMGSEAVVGSINQLKEVIDSILDSNENLSIFQINQVLMVNGQKIDVNRYKWLAEDLVKFMVGVELKGIIFHAGLGERELEVLVEGFSRPKEKFMEKNFWQSFSDEHKLEHIELKQVQYTLMVEEGAVAEGRAEAEGAESTPAPTVSYEKIAREQKLDPEDMTQVRKIIRALLSAAKNIRLYPVDSEAITSYVDQFMGALSAIFKKQPVLTLANISNSLVVNGVSIDTSKMGMAAHNFLKFLASIQLSSLTFLENLSADELKVFIGALGNLPSSGMDSKYWDQFAKDQNLAAILFNKILYEPRVSASRVASEPEPVPEVSTGEFWIGQMSEPVSEELLEPFFKEMPGRLDDLLGKGDEDQVKQIFQYLFQGFQNRPSQVREQIIDSCRRLLESMTLAFQHLLTKVLAGPLLVAFSEERDPSMLREIAFLLHLMSAYLIQFAEYRTASKVLQNLHDRQQKLSDSKDAFSQRLAKILDRNLESKTQKLLVNDLKSTETSRQQGAAQLLGSLGRMTLPLLVDIIKREDDLRTREIAASLLKELGPEAGDLLKRELAMESTAEERLRILEVIDTVTQDLRTELMFAFSDETPEVRQAAFLLSERLNSQEVVELLLEYVRAKDTSMAVAAIQSLGRIKSLAAVDELASLLNSTNNKKMLLVCCQALGQIGSPAGVESLTRILTKKGSVFRRARRNAQVRAAAAFALGQISHPQATEVLADFVDDRNPQIREVARKVANLGSPPH